MTDFWRRWHMTLGSWFRDYIYIPLGGNRNGKTAMIRNTFVVWLFTGLWHGASWNFIVWGLVLFAIIMLEKFCLGNFLNRYKLFGHAWMIVIIPVTWLIFAITDFSELGTYLSRLLPFTHDKDTVLFKTDYAKYWGTYAKYLIAGAIFSTPLPELVYKKIKNSIFCRLLLITVFWASVYCMYKGMDDPFMYFRF